MENTQETKVPETEETQAPKKEKKTKTSKKDEEIARLQAECENEHNLLLRTAAEFDNYKKRTEREKLSVGEYAKANVIKQLLPVLDNIDRAATADSGSADYIKGIELIIKQLLSLKEKLEIKELAAVGEPFDPAVHEAVMHIDDETLGENVVSQVLQQGYKIGDTVIRAAMVQVAN